MNTIIESARRYLRAGFMPIELDARSKRCSRQGWEQERHTLESVMTFHAKSNLGILNGEPSGGLVDIDLDAPESVAVAPMFLPATPLVIGRSSKPRSHFYYRCTPPPATRKFQAPKDAASGRIDMIVELRSTGTQTVWPPSWHPEGDQYVFEGAPRTPAMVPASALEAAVLHVAVASLFARYWPRSSGIRHEVAGAAAGYLLRRALSTEIVQAIIDAAARYAHDEETHSRLRNVATTARKLAAGGHATGGRRLAELLDAPVVEKLETWFGPDSFHAGTSLASVNGRPAGDDVWSRAMTAREFLAGDDPALDFLVNRILSHGSLTTFYSPRGLGKTHVTYAFAVELARRRHAVLLLDRDNAKREIRRRLRAWGAAELEYLKVMTRDDVPPLTDAAAWREFPFGAYELVIVDSLDASTEGIGEQDSAKPARAIAPLLDIAHRADGPAILLLGNTIKSGSHGRGSGVLEDRCDIVFEVRDATDFQPSGTKPWWLELPPAGRDAWADRATRRKQRDRYVLAFVPSKFRVGVEPEPFAFEINLGAEPWSYREVTAEFDAAGEAARARAAAETAQAEEVLVERLADEVTGREVADERPLTLGEAVAVLKEAGAARNRARALLDEHLGRSWRMIKDTTRKGHPSFVIAVNQQWPREKKAEAGTRASCDVEENLFSPSCAARAGEEGAVETLVGEGVRNNGSSPASALPSDGLGGNAPACLRLACATCGSTECSGCDREPGSDDAAPVFETGPWQTCLRCGGRRWRHRGMRGDECATCHPVEGPSGA
jgi:hypothetical protein